MGEKAKTFRSYWYLLAACFANCKLALGEKEDEEEGRKVTENNESGESIDDVDDDD